MDRAFVDSSGQPVDLLVFVIGSQRCALQLSAVRQLLRAVSIAPLPSAPASVEGIINVKGALVPVLDLRGRFGLPPKAPEISDHLILAVADGRTVALRVDRAADLCRVDAGQVEDLDQMFVQARQLAGVAKLPDGLIVIHDLETFLSQAEADALDTALEQLAEVGGDAR